MKKEKKILFYTLVMSLLLIGNAVSGKTLVNERVNVPPLSFYYYLFGINDDGVTVDLSIDVYLGDITVIVMNKVNFNYWKNGRDASAYFHRQELVSGDYSVVLGSPGDYYVVLDNSDSWLFSTEVKIVVSVYSSAETTGIVVAVVIGIGIVIIVIINSGRRKKTQLPPVMPIIQTPHEVTQIQLPTQQTTQQGIKYCKECGSRLDTDTAFCQNCGFEAIAK